MRRSGWELYDEAVACVQQRVRGIGLRSHSFRENKRDAYIQARAHNMSLYVEVEASHQGCEVAETVAGMRVPWEGWACSQRLGLRGSSSVRACSGKRRQRHAVDNNHTRVTPGAHLTSVANSDTGAGMLWRQATLEQARGCGDSGGGGGGGGGGGSGGASSRGSGGKEACDGGSGSAMTSEAACGATPGRGC